MCQLHFCLLLTAYITSNDDDDYVGSSGDHGYGDGAYGDGAYGDHGYGDGTYGDHGYGDGTYGDA